MSRFGQPTSSRRHMPRGRKDMVCGRLAHGDSCVIATWDNLRYTLFFFFRERSKGNCGQTVGMHSTPKRNEIQLGSD